MACSHYEDIRSVIQTLIKNQKDREHLSEKSSFIIKLNGDNGTMVSFKILNPNHFGAKSLTASDDLKTDLTEATSDYYSRLFEISKDIASKDKIDYRKFEVGVTNYGENKTSSHIDGCQDSQESRFTLEEKHHILNKNFMNPIRFNSGTQNTRQETISNNNIKRTKPPSFPLHEKIYKRFQLETIHDTEWGQNDIDGSQLNINESNKYLRDEIIDCNEEFQVFTTDKCEDKIEKRPCEKTNGDPSVCRIYKPWLMLEPTNEDMLAQGLQNEEERKEDCRYLTPDYKPLSLQDNGPEQKRKERRIKKSIKQLVVPHNNTYSSFETKVVDGLRQVVAAKSMTDNKQDGRAANYINNEHDDSTNETLMRCSNKNALTTDDLDARTNHQNINHQNDGHASPPCEVKNDGKVPFFLIVMKDT